MKITPVYKVVRVEPNGRMYSVFVKYEESQGIERIPLSKEYAIGMLTRPAENTKLFAFLDASQAARYATFWREFSFKNKIEVYEAVATNVEQSKIWIQMYHALSVVQGMFDGSVLAPPVEKSHSSCVICDSMMLIKQVDL